MPTSKVIEWLQKGAHGEHFPVWLDCQGDLAFARGSTTGQVKRILRGILQARKVPHQRVAEFLGLDPTVFEELLKGVRDVSVIALAEVGACLGYRLQLKFEPCSKEDEDPDLALLLKQGRSNLQHAMTLQRQVTQHCRQLQNLAHAIRQESPQVAAHILAYSNQLEQARKSAVDGMLTDV